MSVFRINAVLIKRVEFRGNLAFPQGQRKLSVITRCRIKRVSVKRGSTVITLLHHESPNSLTCALLSNSHTGRITGSNKTFAIVECRQLVAGRLWRGRS